MNASPQDQDWDERLRSGLGSPPAPNFAAWCARHPDAVAALKPQVTLAEPRALRNQQNWRTIVTSFKWIAASVLILGGLLWLGWGNGTLSPTAFAETIPGVDEVQTMTWTDIYYVRFTSADGKRTWIQPDRRLYAYRHPGQYRETMLDKNGKPIGVHITDGRAGRTLSLYLQEKKAVLKMPVHPRGERAPFAWVGDLIRERKTGSESSRVKSISLQGEKEIDKKPASRVRVITREVQDSTDLRTDYFFDVVSKQLVGIQSEAGCESVGEGSTYVHVPFDPETASDRNNPAEETWSKMVPVGRVTHEIVLNPKLDPSEFSLDPPTDFTFERQAKPTVTEEEMITYLGAAARFNDNQFPDSPYEAFDRDKFNAASNKEPADRTAAEQALIEIRDKILMREIYRSPIKQFEEDQTTAKSFQYVGSGVKVGQSDKMVGWYQLRGSKKYRALFGDLTVKDVTAAELPLNLKR